MTPAKRPSISRRTALKTAAGAIAIGGISSSVGGQPRTTTQPAAEEDRPCDFEAVYDEAIPSVGTARVFDEQGERGLGSGWVYDRDDSDGYVVTNWHIIDSIFGADVRFSEGEWRRVTELVGADPYADLAVLRIEDLPEYAESIEVADSQPDEGEEVAALGSPLGLEGSITTGRVSALDRSTIVGYGESVYSVTNTMQIDAAVNPGNSGGPLVDCDGEVVGVNFAGVEFFVGENVNFAVSVAMIERVIPALVEGGTFAHPYVGIRGTTVSPTIARVNEIDERTEGVIVESTVAGYPASEELTGSDETERITGIPVGGDVIVAVDGTSVGSTDELQTYLFENARPEETVTLTVVRDGDREEIELTLGTKPHPFERAGLRGPSM